jgi:hypothetical protein
VLDELERARAHHVRLVPAHILGQDVRLVDPAIGGGEADQEGRFGPLEPEPHRRRVGGLDRLHHLVRPLAGGDDPRRREDDLVVARLDVARRHRTAIVEADALAQLERIGQCVRRDRPRLGQVWDRPRARPVDGIHAQKRVVVRGERMDGPERPLPVPVIGGGLRGDQEDQLPAVAWPLLRLGRIGHQQDRGKGGCDQKPRGTDHGRLLGRIVRPDPRCDRRGALQFRRCHVP